MRQIDDCLDGPLENHQPDLIQNKGDEDGKRKQNNDFVHTDQQGIDKNMGEFLGMDQPGELFQPHPLAAVDAVENVEILEGNHNSVHRRILEQQKEYETRNQQKIIIPVIPGQPPFACLFGA
ncbi:hypothetical protein D3C75_713590 [compost metagenome]